MPRRNSTVEIKDGKVVFSKEVMNIKKIIKNIITNIVKNISNNFATTQLKTIILLLEHYEVEYTTIRNYIKI